MVTHVFEDEIISATKFREKQSHWFSLATKRPVTITNGNIKVTLVDRERMRELYLGRNYLELAVKVCDELEKSKNSTTLYWLDYLNDGEKKLFIKEFINNILTSITTGRWNNVEELLDDWKATAETKQDKDFVEEFKKKIPKDKYIPLR